MEMLADNQRVPEGSQEQHSLDTHCQSAGLSPQEQDFLLAVAGFHLPGPAS